MIAECRRQCGDSWSQASMPASRARRRTSSHRCPWRRRPPVEAGQRRQPAPHAGRFRALVLLTGRPHVHVHPACVQHIGAALGQPPQPPPHVGGVGAPGAGRTQAGQPGGGQQLLPFTQPGQHRQLGAGSREQLGGDRRRLGTGPGHQVAARCHGRRCGHRFLVTCHAADGSGGHRQNRVITGYHGCAPPGTVTPPTPATRTPPGGWPGCWPTAVTWTGCAPGPTPATGRT